MLLRLCALVHARNWEKETIREKISTRSCSFLYCRNGKFPSFFQHLLSECHNAEQIIVTLTWNSRDHMFILDMWENIKFAHIFRSCRRCCRWHAVLATNFCSRCVSHSCEISSNWTFAHSRAFGVDLTKMTSIHVFFALKYFSLLLLFYSVVHRRRR